jgi:hypothetical protein
MITEKEHAERPVIETELEIGTIYRVKDSLTFNGYIRAVYMGKDIKGKHNFCFTNFKGGSLGYISKKEIANGLVLIENGYSK